uniref:Uncharacterized protein n=1 Tax=viral metagenome TaxID=1070528 RepID=A0A6C0JAP6_9ZZZZ
MDDTDLISKLKFIGKINDSEKIDIKYMTLQKDTYTTSFIRTFLSNNCRQNTLNFISTVIEQSIHLIDTYFTSNNESKIRMAQNIYKDFLGSIKGLRSLKTTYSNDTMFCCKIQTIIEHIETKTLDFNKKYTIESSESPIFEDFSD